MDFDYGTEEYNSNTKYTSDYENQTNINNSKGENNMENNIFNGEVIVENVNDTVQNEEQEKQLLVQEFKKNYLGERVNMADIESIFHYGEDVLLELEQVVTASSSDFGSQKIGESKTIIKEKIDEIINFNDNLDKEDELQKKIDERSNTLFGKLINKITGDYKLEGRDTYTDACKKVEDNCAEIERIVDETGLRTTEEFKAGIQYHTEQERVLVELENLITMGKIDLDEYERKIALKKEMGPQPGEDEHRFNLQIKKAENNIADFKDHLETLERSRILGYNDLNNNMVLHEVNKKSMKELYEIKTTTLTFLRIVGKDAIRTRNASDTLDTIETINDGLNAAIVSNSKKQLENAQRAQTIAQKGTIYNETVNTLVKDLSEKKKILEQGFAQEQKALEAKQKIDEKAIAEISKITEVIKRRVNYSENDVELLESMTLPELPETTVVESQSANTNTTAKSPLLKSINPQNSGK
ncbi:MAG: hypothetical protein ACI4OT_01765 [Bacilli bacterium]